MSERKIDLPSQNLKWYAKLGRWFSTIPWYGYVFAILIIVLEHSFYMAAEPLGRTMAKIYGWGPFGDPTDLDNWQWLGWTPKTAIDDMFPLTIEFWIIPYVSFLPFIGFYALVAAKGGREHYTEFVLSCLISWFIGFLIMGFAPACMNREVEHVITRVNVGDFWAKLYGSFLSPHNWENFNLAPSFHCLCTGLVMMFTMYKKEINRGLRYFGITWSILIFLSTVYTKHHYFLDFVFAAIILLITWSFMHFFKVGIKIWENHPKGAQIVDRTFPDIFRILKSKKKK